MVTPPSKGSVGLGGLKESSEEERRGGTGSLRHQVSQRVGRI